MTIKRICIPSGLLVAVAIVATSALVSCDFTWTIFGMMDNQNDPRSYEYADYSIEVIAGIGAGTTIPDEGLPASELRLSVIGGMTSTATHLYITDTLHNRVVRIMKSAPFTVNTIAGTGTPGKSGDGGPATQAELFYPTGIAVAADGTVYVLDSGNSLVRSISTNGTISTLNINDGAVGNAWDASIGTIPNLAGSLAIYSDSLYLSSREKLFKISLGSGSPVASMYPAAGYWDYKASGGTLHAGACTVGPDGTVYIAYQRESNSGPWSDFLGAIAPGSASVTEYDVDPQYSTQLAVHSDGRIVFYRTGGSISSFNKMSSATTPWNGDTISVPMFCLDNDGRLFYEGHVDAASNDNAISHTLENTTAEYFAGKALKTTAVSADRGDFVHPYDLALKADGSSIYFTEKQEGTVRRLDIGSSIALMENPGTSSQPGSIVISTNPIGAVYCMSDDLRLVEDSGVKSSLRTGATFIDIAKSPESFYFGITSSYVYKNINTTYDTSVAGNSLLFDYSQNVNGLAPTEVTLGNPTGITFAPDGTMFLAEGRGRILAIKDGKANRYAGGIADKSGSGFINYFYFEDEFKMATKVGLSDPNDISYGPDGSLYVATSWPSIMRINPAGTIEQLRCEIDGMTANIISNHGILVDAAGCLYIPAGYQIIKATPRF